MKKIQSENSRKGEGSSDLLNSGETSHRRKKRSVDLNESTETELDYEDDVNDNQNQIQPHVRWDVEGGRDAEMTGISDPEDDGEIFSEDENQAFDQAQIDEIVPDPNSPVTFNKRGETDLSQEEIEEKEIEKWTKENPAFGRYIKKMVANEIKEVQNAEKGRQNKGNKTKLNKSSPVNAERLKSPSDTTIYAPILNQVQKEQNEIRRRLDMSSQQSHKVHSRQLIKFTMIHL